MLLQGSGLNTVRFSGVYAEIFAQNLNTPAYFYDRWHREDPYDDTSRWIPGKWPASRFISDAGAMYNESSVWRRDASYLRLKNISIGYTLPRNVLRKMKFDTMRVYVSADNVWTWTKYTGPDPEVSTRNSVLTPGFDWSAYPRAIGVTAGVSFTF